MQRETLTLYELNAMVREVIDLSLNGDYWVEAELSECRESKGHCYMELVQKGPDGNTPVARASAKCWRSSWQVLNPYFVKTTGQQLRAGLKVRLKVHAQFHEAFGFSWIVTDIDATFTLGDMARRRQEIIRQLKQEGVFDLQKQLALPLFCQRIAVVSAETAAGYGDFCRQLKDNGGGFAFEVTLFPAAMQGEEVERSIVNALNRIYADVDSYDCVVIIRGGGATSDMAGFDSLLLAENVAQFPLPVITGIGHDRDECILDMVSCVRVKTPTAAAALLTDHLQHVADRIDTAEQRLLHTAQTLLLTSLARIETLSVRIPALFNVARARQEATIDTLSQKLTSAIRHHTDLRRNAMAQIEAKLGPLAAHLLAAHRHRLELLSQRKESLDPQLLLKRGYSITMKNGRAVRSADELTAGDEIETRLERGTVRSTVKELNQTNKRVKK